MNDTKRLVEMANDLNLDGRTVYFIESMELTSEELFSNSYNDKLHAYVDSLIDVYNEDLIEWAKRNTHHIDEAILQYGYTDTGFISMIRQGQYLKYESELSNELEELRTALENEEEDNMLHDDNHGENNQIQLVIEALEELTDMEYGVTTKQQYDEMIIALDEFNQLLLGSMEFNNMWVNSRLIYNYILEMLI